MKKNAKTKWLTICFSILLTLTSCGQNKKHTSNLHKHTNALINEDSPYLLQHAHNPVNWQPWGDKALEQAKKENKLLLISIGYAACHWCHVMEHESFEDTTVARLMNENFICIKVDREQRPDVDQIYMDAVQLISGRGGWPLNALALPNGKPFFAGTYFPKKDWIKVLNYFIDIQQRDPSQLSEHAEKVTNGIAQMKSQYLLPKTADTSQINFAKCFKTLQESIDYKFGGIGKAPKFPMPAIWEFLLEYGSLYKDSTALEAVFTTLNKMADGGIYDHIGGGFARYATDSKWHIPHFEKMLYDNSQLVSLYSHAWQITKKPRYKEVVFETLDFIQRELMHNEKYFYASLDADSDGEEGKFYVWTKKEIQNTLGRDADWFIKYYDITDIGNWEHGKNILKHNNKSTQSSEKLNKAKTLLLKKRAERIRPGLDDKMITSWNALMLKGYIEAYKAFGEKKFLDIALKNAHFLKDKMSTSSGLIYRNYKNQNASIEGFLDDYAFTIDAYISLYEATFDEKWIHEANATLEYVNKNFLDTASGLFFYTHKEYSNLIVRKMEISDNVIVSSNSSMGKNLWRLGQILDNKNYQNQAEKLLSKAKGQIPQNGYFYANWASLGLEIQKPFNQVIIVGENAINIQRELQLNYLPNTLFIGGKSESLPLTKNKMIKGQTTIYVCQNKVCQLPVTKANKALEQIVK